MLHRRIRQFALTTTLFWRQLRFCSSVTLYTICHSTWWDECSTTITTFRRCSSDACLPVWLVVTFGSVGAKFFCSMKSFLTSLTMGFQAWYSTTLCDWSCAFYPRVSSLSSSTALWASSSPASDIPSTSSLRWLTESRISSATTPTLSCTGSNGLTRGNFEDAVLIGNLELIVPKT